MKIQLFKHLHNSVKESHGIQEIRPEGVVGVVKGVLTEKHICKKENVSLVATKRGAQPV